MTKLEVMKKILLLRFSSIGDIVLTTPVIRCLKKQVSDVELHFATKDSFGFLLEENPYVDKVHLLKDEKSNMKQLLSNLKSENFDLIVDLHNNLRTFRIKNSLGVKSYSFDKLTWEKILLVKFKIDKMPNVHIVQRYLDTVKKLGVVNDENGLDYFYPDKDEIEMDWLPKSFQKGFSVFALGGQHATKRLPISKMIELCTKINGPIILLGGGNDDEKAAREIEQFFHPLDSKTTPKEEEVLLNDLNKKAHIFNGVGKFSLNQSASVVKLSSRVFTHDTAVMHIASAFKKEVFSIWGNTTPSLGMYPYETKFTIFEVKGLSCRPCSKIGFDQCPKGHFKCMNDQKFDFYLPDAGW